jgi:hypothetical protein
MSQGGRKVIMLQWFDVLGSLGVLLGGAGLIIGALTDDAHWMLPALVIAGAGVVLTSLSAGD